MFTPGPPVSVGGVQCRVTSLPLIESHDVDGTFISVGDPGTTVRQQALNTTSSKINIETTFHIYVHMYMYHPTSTFTCTSSTT